MYTGQGRRGHQGEAISGRARGVRGGSGHACGGIVEDDRRDDYEPPETRAPDDEERVACAASTGRVACREGAQYEVVRSESSEKLRAWVGSEWSE